MLWATWLYTSGDWEAEGNNYSHLSFWTHKHPQRKPCVKASFLSVGFPSGIWQEWKRPHFPGKMDVPAPVSPPSNHWRSPRKCMCLCPHRVVQASPLGVKREGYAVSPAAHGRFSLSSWRRKGFQELSTPQHSMWWWLDRTWVLGGTCIFARVSHSLRTRAQSPLGRGRTPFPSVGSVLHQLLHQSCILTAPVPLVLFLRTTGQGTTTTVLPWGFAYTAGS